MNTLTPFTSPEKTVRALLRGQLAAVAGRPEAVGTSLPDVVTDLYVRISRVPGGGTRRVDGDFVLDIETFHPSYSSAESAAFAIEAIMLGYPWTVEVDPETRVVIDAVTQNQGVSETFWDDDSVHRLLATYVITMRR